MNPSNINKNTSTSVAHSNRRYPTGQKCGVLLSSLLGFVIYLMMPEHTSKTVNVCVLKRPTV